MNDRWRGAIGIAGLLLSLVVLLGFAPGPAEGSSRPRVIVTTDGEIDDRDSMIRFLMYANEWDIEGIVTSSSQYHWQGHNWAGDDWLDPLLDAYAQVYPNLVKHDPGYPTPELLRKRAHLGNVKAEGEMEEETAAVPETAAPEIYKQLHDIRDNLEDHYREMQDIEFTIERDKLYMLQTRNGKRTAAAAVKIAVDLVDEGMISEEEAVERGPAVLGLGGGGGFPERAGPIQWPGVQAGDLDAELAPVAGFGQGDMAHVEFEVEVIIVDPVGMIEIQRH